MALGNPIQLRLNLAKHLTYEEEARRQGKPLAVYIRERLEIEDALRAEIAGFRGEFEEAMGGLRQEIADVWRGVKDLSGISPAAAASPTQKKSIVELLLLIRSITPPDRLSMVHAELRRLGLEPWTYNSEGVH